MVVKIDSICQLLPLNRITERSQVCAANNVALVQYNAQSRAPHSIIQKVRNKSLKRQLNDLMYENYVNHVSFTIMVYKLILTC